MNRWRTASVVLVAILLITVTLSVINTEKEKIENLGPEKVYIGHSENILDNAYSLLVDSIVKLEKNTSDETLKAKLNEVLEATKDDEVVLDNFNKESAVKALQDMFISIGDDLGVELDEGSQGSNNQEGEIADIYSESLSKKLSMLDNEDTDIEDVLSDDVISKLYLAEEFESNKFNRQFTASSLLIYYDVIASNNNIEIQPAIQMYEEIVYMDTKFMTVHIPLDLLVGNSTGVAFEMQYVNGEWKLNPYTSMMSLNLMSILNSAESAE